MIPKFNILFDADGGSGGTPPALPAELVGKFISVEEVQAKYVPKAEVESKFVSLDTLNGTKGAHKQEVDKLRGEMDAVKQARATLEAQFQDMTGQLGTATTKLAELEPLAGKAKENEANFTKADKANVRLKTLLKYPNLLVAGGESILALVETSTLEGEAFESHIKALAEAMPNPNRGAGGTPPKPAGSAPSIESLRAEVQSLMTAGKYDEARAKNNDLLALLDKQKPFLPPAASSEGGLV